MRPSSGNGGGAIAAGLDTAIPVVTGEAMEDWYWLELGVVTANAGGAAFANPSGSSGAGLVAKACASMPSLCGGAATLGEKASRAAQRAVDRLLLRLGIPPSPSRAKDMIDGATRVGNAASKTDSFHTPPASAFADIANNATVTYLTGGDGTTRILVQMLATHGNKTGRWEWMIQNFNQITHEFFVNGGTINGIPNVP